MCVSRDGAVRATFRPRRHRCGVLTGTFTRMRCSSTPWHRDGSPAVSHFRRSLRVEHDSPSRLLRCAQRDRCRECGNPVEWYERSFARPVCLHPREVSAVKVPSAHRWHVSSGVAHPAGDGSAWCRLAHAHVCPAREALPETSELDGLRRVLALNTRRLINSGAFTPGAPPSRPTAQPAACRPARPVVQLLYVRYLAAHPVDEIQCVAQTRRRDRCTQRLLPRGKPRWASGRWYQRRPEGGNLLCPARSWPYMTSRPCPTPSNCAGACSAVPLTPQFRPQRTSRWLTGNPSTPCSITRTSTTACPITSVIRAGPITSTERACRDVAPRH